MTSVARVVDVDGIPVSALLQEARQPRAVVLALHGGSAYSGYFDYPDRPRLSLLRTGAALGFTVVAIDRPGYGSSAPYAAELATVERRVDLAYAAVDRLLAARPRGAGIFVLAHSIGCELALRMAVDDRGRDLLGVELAGTGRHHHDDAVGILGDALRADPAPRRPRGVRDLLWQPSRLYPEDVVGGARISSPRPPTKGSWRGAGSRPSPSSPRRCASPCTTASANTNVCGGPDPRRSPTSRPCSPPRPGSPSTNRRTAATT